MFLFFLIFLCQLHLLWPPSSPIMSFISFSFVILVLLIHAIILRTPLCIFHQNCLRLFFAPAPTSVGPTGPNIEFHQVCPMLFCLPHRNLQNGWSNLFVVNVFNLSSNFILKSGGMGSFFCSRCFSKVKPAAMLV
jgi:hypothetical protein